FGPGHNSGRFFACTVPRVDVLLGPHQSTLVGQPRQGHVLGGVVVEKPGLAGLAQGRPDDRVHLVDASWVGRCPCRLACGLSPCRLETSPELALVRADRKSTRLNSSHVSISYAVFCLKKKKTHT